MNRFGFLLVCLLLSGCSGRSVFFRVVDGETGEPISNIRVEAEYRMRSLGEVPPMDSYTSTDGNGEARLHVWRSRQLYRLEATDPLNRYYLVHEETVGPLPPTGVPKSKSYKAYRLPKPTLTIVIPDGYRGPVYITYDRNSPPLPAGQRTFEMRGTPPEITVPASGAFLRAQLAFVHASGDEIKWVSYAEGRNHPDLIGLHVLPPRYHDLRVRYFLGDLAERHAFEPDSR